MVFGNEEEAKQCLAHISYFRLKYYWTDMRDEETEHDFKKGALFDDVIARYNFDRNLRLILFDAIEIIDGLRLSTICHRQKVADYGTWILLFLSVRTTTRISCLTSNMSLTVALSLLPKSIIREMAARARQQAEIEKLGLAPLTIRLQRPPDRHQSLAGRLFLIGMNNRKSVVIFPPLPPGCCASGPRTWHASRLNHGTAADIAPG